MRRPLFSPLNRIAVALALPLLLAVGLWAWLSLLSANAGNSPSVSQLQNPKSKIQTPEDELWRTLETPFEQVGRVIEDKEGNIWLVSLAGTFEGNTIIPGEGLAKFEQGRWITYTVESTHGGLPGDSIYAALFDRQGDLWLSVAANEEISDTVELTPIGLVRFDGQNWQTFTVTNTHKGLADDNIRDIFEDKDDNLWFATLSGLSRYDGQDWQVVAAKDELGTEGIFRVFQDSQKRLWVSLLDFKDWQGVPRGVARSAPVDASGVVTGWERFAKADGLADDYVLSITEDAGRNIWFGTANGVSRFDGEKWKTFNEDNSNLSGNVFLKVVAGYEGQVWGVISSTRGIPVAVKYDEGEWQDFDKPWAYTRDIFKDSEQLIWFSSGEYYLGYHRQQTFNIKDSNLGGDFPRLFEAADGAIWVGTLYGGGLSRYKAGEWQTFSVESGDLNGNNIWDIFQTSDGAIWVSTGGGDGSRYLNNKWQTISEIDGLSENYRIGILQASDGAIWVWTNSGVSRYQNGVWQTYIVEKGDLSSSVSRFFKATDGTIWAETSDGQGNRYQAGKWQVVKNEEYKMLNVQPSSLDTTYPRRITDRDGFLWFITDDDASIVRSRSHPSHRLPWVEIVKVNDITVTTPIISLTYDNRRRVKISLTGNDLATHPKYLQNFVKLANSSVYTDWQVVPYDQSFEINELSPGQHTLHLKVIDEDGNESAPAQLDIIVENLSLADSLQGRYTIPGLGVVTLLQLLGGGGTGLIILLGLVGLVAIWRKQQQIRQNVINKLNPYIAGDPIDNPELFFGREELIATIMRSLPGNHIAVEGPRRSGKTSLLNEVARRLRQLDDPQFCFVPVKFNCQSATQSEFFYKLMRALFKTLKEIYPTLAWPLLIHQQRAETYNDFDFEDDLHSLLATLQTEVKKEIKIILLLDEGDTLNQYDLAMQGKIRTLISDNKTLKMVWVGTSIMKAAKDLGSPWYNLQITHPLLPLPPNEAHRLIIEPAKRLGYTYQVEATERILAYSNGQPYIIQYLCHRAVETMLVNERATIALADVETAISQLEAEKSAQDTASVVYQVRAQAEGQLSLAETPTPYENNPEGDVP